MALYEAEIVLGLLIAIGVGLVFWCGRERPDPLRPLPPLLPPEEDDEGLR